jgi:hypothetical protein
MEWWRELGMPGWKRVEMRHLQVVLGVFRSLERVSSPPEEV